MINRCHGCMEKKTQDAKCPYCGWLEGSTPESALHLQPGTILQEKYLIGKALGQGGFGITYLAWDMNLNLKLAIKEYLPQELAYRTGGQSEVSIYKKNLADNFNYGLEKFMEEARTLARFNEHPNIVSVRDFFKANGTAYIVMNYIEGVTLKEYLESRQEPLPFEQALKIFIPVLDALKEVHVSGVLHRDISPDNLLLDAKGRVVLIDFGAARQAMGDKSRSMSVIMKAGYSPPEQYQSKGIQGPWTDIYAVAATMYRTITGQVPLEAIDRMVEDDLILPSQLKIAIEKKHELSLMKALAIRTSERFQRVEDFQLALMQELKQADKMQSEPAAGSSGAYEEKRSVPEPMRGEDITKEILLSRLEADLGSKRSIIVDLEAICLDCGGTGIKNGSKCFKCDGNGKEQKQLNVKIPAGVKEGTLIRLRGQGSKGSNGGRNGDFFLAVKLEEYKKERSTYSQFDPQVIREKTYAKGREEIPRRENRSLTQKFHQYMHNHLGSKNHLLNYLTVIALGVYLLISIDGYYGFGDILLGIVGSGEKESGQSINHAVIAGLDADYYIDYENGTIPLGDLPIGARVVDPSWEWEFRTGNDYARESGDATRPVIWIIVAKDHYIGLDPHVTLLSENSIGKQPFDNSTDRGSRRGSNHWGNSGTTNATFGLRPWLNSDGIHSGEGFFQYFSDNFKRAVLPTTLPNKEWNSENSYTTTDRVFIASTTELGDTEHINTYQIGIVYPFFQDASDSKRRAKVGENNEWYMTRSPALEATSNSSDFIREVVNTGAIIGSGVGESAYTGVRPALNLKSEILVSEIKH